MGIHKKITEDNELYLYMNGKLIYKRWMDHGYSKVFDIMAYNKNTFVSIIEDESGNVRHKRKIFINGYTCKTKDDFWKSYSSQIPSKSAKYFGQNLDALNDAITAKGPGFPDDCIIEIIGTDNLVTLFGLENFQVILDIFESSEFIDLIVEK